MLFAGSITINSNAQEVIKSTANIVVHMEEQDHSSKLTMTFQVITDYIFYGYGAKEHIITADKKGNFKFHLAELKKPVLITITKNTYDGDSKAYSRELIVSSKLLEPGDNIRVDYRVKDKTKKIIGTGSSKLIAWERIRGAKPDNVEWYKSSLLSPLSKILLDTLVEKTDSVYAFRKRLLLSYKNVMSKSAFEWIDAIIYGETYSNLISVLINSFNKPEDRKIKLDFFKMAEKYTRQGSVEANSQSSEYLNLLVRKAVGKAKLMDPDPKNEFRNAYNELVKQHSGVLREKVLVYFFSNNLRGAGAQNSDDIYLDALNYVKKPEYRLYLVDLGAAKHKGNDAYNFKMPDETGKMVSLSDFKGKVVVIDCWFTGCNACSYIAKEMEKDVLPNFKDNPNVVFVSVNVDRSKEMWLTSLKGGKYTNPHSINLYTEGLESKHPFIYEYKLQGFPQLLLIDKNGKIFTPSMPRNTKGMNEVINEALNAGS